MHALVGVRAHSLSMYNNMNVCHSKCLSPTRVEGGMSRAEGVIEMSFALAQCLGIAPGTMVRSDWIFLPLSVLLAGVVCVWGGVTCVLG